MSKEALKLALAALECKDGWGSSIRSQKDRAITAIKQALEQPVQEPVAILNHAHGVYAFRSVNLQGLPDGEYQIYTTPLAAPVQQSQSDVAPVAWRVKWPAIGGGHKWIMVDRPTMVEAGFVNEALYTAPPAAPDLQAELDATNKQVEILSDALAESRREVAALTAVQPVAWAMYQRGRLQSFWLDKGDAYDFEFTSEHEWKPLYTTPPAAQQEPVAVVDANDEGYWADILPDRTVKVGQLLYAEAQPAPVQPVASLKEADVLMMAEAHGIDPCTKGLYGFYIDCISSQPAAQSAHAQEPVALPDLPLTPYHRADGAPLWDTHHLHAYALRYADMLDAITKPAAQRPWVGLTDGERTEIRREHYARTLPLMEAVEAKLKEKNA